MRSPLVPLLMGLAFTGGAIGIQRQQQENQRADLRDIAGLRAELDSVRAAAARATTGPDSLQLAKSISDRKYMLSRREFHVPTRQESIDGWWRLTGPGTMLSLVGVLLLALAGYTRVRARAG